MTDLIQQVANEIVDQRFQTFLKESDYHLDRRQVKRIKKYVKQIYAAKVRRIQEPNRGQNLLSVIHQKSQASGVNLAISTDHSNVQNPGPVKHFIEENADSIRNTSSLTESLLEECNDLGYADSHNLGQSLEEHCNSEDQRSRSCVSCRQGHLKCVLQGKNCVACERSGKVCTFRPDDNKHHFKFKDSTLSKSRVFENVELRRCIRCRQKHIKCVLQDASCLACIKAKLSCFFRPGDLEHNAKLTSDHQQFSASLHTSFTGSVIEPKAPLLISNHDDDPPTSHSDQIYPCPGSRSLSAGADARFTASSSKHWNRLTSLDRPKDSSRSVHVSPEKPRGHLQNPSVVCPVVEDQPEGKSCPSIGVFWLRYFLLRSGPDFLIYSIRMVRHSISLSLFTAYS